MLAFQSRVASISRRGVRSFSALTSDFAAVTSTAGSGVKVGSVVMPGETATVTVWMDAGSRHESVANNGVAHLFETSSLQANSKAIAELGGMVTGYTTRDQVVFEARVLGKDVPKATALLGELVKPAADATQAKEAILSEIEASKTNPSEVLMEHLHDAAYLDTSMGMSVLGTAESVAKLSAEDVAAYARKYVTAERTVVAAAGAFDKAAFDKAAAESFSGLPSASSSAVEVATPNAIFTGSDKRMRFDSMPDAHIAFAFESVPFGAPEMYPLMVMQAYLGSFDATSATVPAKNLTSKLAIDQGEQQAATAFSVINMHYKDSGLFGLYLHAADNELESSMWYSLWNLVRLCHKTSDAEVEFAKTQLKAKISKQMSSTAGVASDLAKALSYAGRPIPLSEIHDAIDAVTAEDVKATAKKIINDNDHALAAVGGIYELPDYNWIRRRSHWLRY